MNRDLREPRLLERATFGPRPGDAETLRRQGAEVWLARQLAPGPDRALDWRLTEFPALGLEPGEMLEGLDLPMMQPERRRERGARDDRRERIDPDTRKELVRRTREVVADVAGARFVRAVHGRYGLREVMLDFWSNHFSIFARKFPIGALLPDYERVLGPRILGRFEDLLVAVAKSPAMLFYLDNWISTSRELPAFVRRRLPRGRGGINENYARELLELHTLGVHGGYDQDDVREVARVFTGWTLESRRRPEFRFREILHDPDPKQVLGERTRGDGMEEGELLLRRLARHPSTAQHLATKLAARFVDDDPPPALVGRAARRYLDTEGDIAEVVSLILRSPELADPSRKKLKTPFRFAASAVRRSGGQTDGGRVTLLALNRLGEVPYFARTPAGFPEEAPHWVDPGAVLERMGFAFALARDEIRGTRLGDGLPRPALDRRLGRDEERALAIAAPEFQWA